MGQIANLLELWVSRQVGNLPAVGQGASRNGPDDSINGSGGFICGFFPALMSANCSLSQVLISWRRRRRSPSGAKVSYSDFSRAPRGNRQRHVVAFDQRLLNFFAVSHAG